MTSSQQRSIPKNREVKIALARKSFWHFCKVMSPDFYSDDRPHLMELCQTLDDLYCRRLKKADGSPYKKLIIQMPPRHGKSRTLTNFSAWTLGLKNENKIITASFNDDLAQDFSRHTRDIITEERTLQEHIVYRDIFDAVVKKGDASYKKWALEGQFFNYKGTGIGGSVTGRGGNIIIVDDPIKDAEIAYNEMALDKIWLWYTGTFLSRAEEGAIRIFCMTPWAKKDPVSRLLEAEGGDWFVLTMPVIENDTMLCPGLLSHDSFLDLQRVMDENIFSANYKMERLDIKGRLYAAFNEYTSMPENTEMDVAYVDTADEGNDYLCSIHAKRKGLYYFVTDIIYTQESQETTEPKTAKTLEENETKVAIIESNNGGRAFARNVDRLTKERGYRCSIRWFHQSKNKRARIMTNAASVQSYVLFPEGWGKLWPEFYSALINYQKEGKNKHDDAPDAITGLIEKGTVSRGMSVPDISIY